ncbi:MAG: hypothetical protein KQJ78_12965 [Deltaproteobacteria bacterium]|nr:hypothetical protein [Deltaproteobacteria bacterium]
MSRGLQVCVISAVILGLACAAGPPQARARQTVRASVASDGTQANHHSDWPRISADGRYVFFTSAASNLVAGDTNGVADIFRHDLVTGQTIRVNLDNDGQQANGGSLYCGVDAAGRFVAFDSEATNLVAGDSNLMSDVFVRDIQAGNTTRVSVDPLGGDPDGYSYSPGVSGDGRYIAFFSSAQNLVSGTPNGESQYYMHDRLTGGTVLLSQNATGQWADADGGSALRLVTPSSDGTVACFASSATNLVNDDSNAEEDVFLRDVPAGETSRASLAAGGGQVTGSSYFPHLTPDARYVLFTSDAADLVAGDSNGSPDLFRKDTATGEVTRVSLAGDGSEADGASNSGKLCADGGLAAFDSLASNLVPGDTNGFPDVFVKNLTSGDIFRASVNSGGSQANGDSGPPDISSESNYVAFASDATNLVPGDSNGRRDVFVNGPFLEEAVDNLGLDISSAGNQPWRAVYWLSKSGGDAAQTGAIPDGYLSTMSTTVIGPGVLSFWWKVSSQPGVHTLNFYLDLQTATPAISGNVDWTLKSFSLPAGEHHLMWAYVKDDSGPGGADAGWVDQVQFGASTRKTMYRAYNEALMYHFFTTRASEFNNAVAAGYINESSDPAKLFYMSAEQAPGTVPLHRLYNANSGRHYYTKSNAERDSLVALGWVFERDEGCLFTSAAAAPADAIEVFHLYHPVIGTHLYTKNAYEAAWVVANLPPWQQHTSLGWAYNSLTVGARAAGEGGVSPDSAFLRYAAGQTGVDLTRLPAWRALAGAPAPGPGGGRLGRGGQL